MIYLADRHVEDYLHVLANVNTLRILRTAFSEEKICFISAEAHNNKVRAFFTDSDPFLEFKTFENRRQVNNLASRAFSLTKRAFDDIFFFKSLFDRSTLDDIVVISHIYPHSLIFFNLLKVFYPQQIVLVMLHGEIEYSLFAKGAGQKLIGIIYKLCFKIRPKRLNYIFLTKASENILADSDLSVGNQSIFIELPTIVAENIDEQKEIFVYRPLKIGHIGSAGKRKNVELLYLLAERTQDLILSHLIQFSVIGVLEFSIKPYLNSLVINFVNDAINKPIERDLYDKEISNLDFVIFFYGINDFLLRSSAAFFDAVLYEKPVIALNNRFFIELFKKQGVMGYLCENLEEMKSLISKIALNTEEVQRDMVEFKKNMKNYKSTLSIMNIASDLKNQIIDLLPDSIIRKYGKVNS